MIRITGKPTAVGEYIVLACIEQDDKTPAGIYLPATAKEKLDYGQISSIGSDVPKNELSNNQFVCYKSYSQHPLSTSDGDFVTVHYKDIMAIIR